MSGDFFTYNTSEIEGEGFAYFSVQHILCLMAILLIIIACTRIYIRFNGEKQTRILRMIAVINLLAELIKDAILMIRGEMDMYQLPLHICGVSLFVYLFHAYTGKAAAGETAVLLCMPAAIMALMFPDWNDYPMWNFMNIHGFFGHMLLVLYPVMLLASGRAAPTFKTIWKTYIFLFATMLPIYIFDRMTGLNYYFINHPPQDTPLEILQDALGLTGYRMVYSLLLVLMTAVTCLITGRISHTKNHNLY